MCKTKVQCSCNQLCEQNFRNLITLKTRRTCYKCMTFHDIPSLIIGMKHDTSTGPSFRLYPTWMEVNTGQAAEYCFQSADWSLAEVLGVQCMLYNYDAWKWSSNWLWLWLLGLLWRCAVVIGPNRIWEKPISFLRSCWTIRLRNPPDPDYCSKSHGTSTTFLKNPYTKHQLLLANLFNKKINRSRNGTKNSTWCQFAQSPKHTCNLKNYIYIVSKCFKEIYILGASSYHLNKPPVVNWNIFPNSTWTLDIFKSVWNLEPTSKPWTVNQGVVEVLPGMKSLHMGQNLWCCTLTTLMTKCLSQSQFRVVMLSMFSAH